RDLLAKRSDSAAVRNAAESHAGYDEALWKTLCDMGVAGLSIPEEFGGAGAGREASAVAFEELGRTLTPSPLLGSAIVCGVLLVVAGDGDDVGVYETTSGQRTMTPTMDVTRRLATVTFDGAEARRVGGPASSALSQARTAAHVALAAEQVGAASAALEQTVA